MRWGRPPICTSLSMGERAGSWTPCPSLSMFLPGPYLQRNGTWWLGADKHVSSHANHIGRRDDRVIIFFTEQDKIKRSMQIRAHLGMCTLNLKEPIPPPQWMHWQCIFRFPGSLWRIGNCFLESSRNYNRYTQVTSEVIKEHRYELASYGKVEKLGLHSVKKGTTKFCVIREQCWPPLL